MKLIHSEDDHFTFRLSRREKPLLVRVLQIYPLVPPAHHRLSRSTHSPKTAENQMLLEEAVAEQRAENRKRVRQLLVDRSRFQETADGIQLVLKREEIEWLLQVLNDIRIGAWLMMGEPEEGVRPEINPTTAPHLFAMEISGHFQMEILAALGHEEPTQPDD